MALIPGAQLPQLEADGEQELSFATDSHEIASWVASYMEEPDGDVMELARGGDDFDPDTAQTPPVSVGGGSFEAPPPGDWIVTLMVRSVTGEDAIVAWQVMVD